MQNWESLLSPHEFQAYLKFFSAASGGKPNIVTGQEAVRFFARSGIPNEILSDIWETADRDNLGYLTPETFSVALKLIACAQHGREVAEPILSTVVPLPQFEGFNPDATESTAAAAQVITAAEREKYLGIFRVHQPVDGLIDGEKAKSIFLKSKLPPDVLGKIWDLANVRKSGNLNQTEFVIAMHYIAKIMDGTITTLPLQLPAKVYASASGSIQSSPVLRRTSMSPSMTSRQTTGTSSPMIPGRQRAESLDSLGSAAFSSMSSKWEIKPEERMQYNTFFDRLDTRHTGFIQGTEAVEFFKNSRLPEQTLARIWDLADTEHRGRLSRDEFAVAMHLIQKSMAGEALPQSLPKSLLPAGPATNTPISQPQPTMVTSPESLGQPVPPNEDTDLLGDFGNNEQLTEETNQVNQLQYQLSTLNGQVANVQAQKTSIQQSRDQLVKEKENLHSQLAQIQTVQQAETKRLAEIRDLVAAEEPSWVQARLEHQEAEQQLLELKREIDQERAVLENSRAESENLRHRVHQVQEETALLQQQLERLRAYVGEKQQQQQQQQKPSFDDIFGKASSAVAAAPAVAAAVESPKNNNNKQKKAAPPPPPPQRRHHNSQSQQALANTTTRKSRAPPPPPPTSKDIQEKTDATSEDLQARDVDATALLRKEDKEQLPLSNVPRDGAPKESLLLSGVETPLQEGTAVKVDKELDEYAQQIKDEAHEDRVKDTETSSSEAPEETTTDEEQEDEEDNMPLSQLAGSVPEKEAKAENVAEDSVTAKKTEESLGASASPAVSAAIAAAIAANAIEPIVTATAAALHATPQTRPMEEKGKEPADEESSRKEEKQGEQEEDCETEHQPHNVSQPPVSELDKSKEERIPGAAEELKGSSDSVPSETATPKEAEEVVTGERNPDAQETKEETKQQREKGPHPTAEEQQKQPEGPGGKEEENQTTTITPSTQVSGTLIESEQEKQKHEGEQDKNNADLGDGTLSKQGKADSTNFEEQSSAKEEEQEEPPSVAQEEAMQDPEKSNNTTYDDFDAVFMERPSDKEKASLSDEGTGEGESFEIISSVNSSSADASKDNKNPFDSFFEEQEDDFDSAFAGPLADAKVVHSSSSNDPSLSNFDDAFGVEEPDKGKKLSWATNFGGFQFAEPSENDNTKQKQKQQTDDWDPFLGSTARDDDNARGTAATEAASEHVGLGFEDAFDVSSANAVKEQQQQQTEGTELDTSSLGQLVSMGFDRAAAKEALDRYDQDLTKATNFLLDSGK